MERSIEDRLRCLETRLDRIERLLVFNRAPAATVRPLPPPPASPRRVRPRPDLEDVLGGRVLAWVGAVAVVLGVVFFLVTAVRRGWIDEPTRVVLAFLGSTVLLV